MNRRFVFLYLLFAIIVFSGSGYTLNLIDAYSIEDSSFLQREENVSASHQSIIVTDIDVVDQPSDIVIQSDNKIVVSGVTRSSYSSQSDGSQVLMRHLESGLLDPTFGNSGIVETDIGSAYNYANGVALQQDGKIVTVGNNDSTGWLTLARFNSDGSLDNSFGLGPIAGVVTGTIGTTSYLQDLEIQSNGDIVAVGASWENFKTSFLLVRYQANGMLENSFGDNGAVITTLTMESNRTVGYDVAIQNDGKIVVGGYDDTEDDKAFLARYNFDGTLDTNFGTMGFVTASFGENSAFWTLTLQPDGKIIAAGKTDTDGALITRFNSDGSLDSDFANNGVLIMADYGYPGQTISDVALFDDGSIVAAGIEGVLGSSAQQIVILLEPDGSFSKYWGQGWTILESLSSYDTLSAVAILNDDTIIAAGTTNTPSIGGTDMLLVEYLRLFPQSYFPLIKVPSD